MSLSVTSKRHHHFVTSWLSPDAVVVDLGANRGFFSSEINADYDCKCYAIEAVPSLYGTIQTSTKIRKYNHAITATNGPVTFHMSTQDESGSMGDLPENLRGESITVEGITLKTFLDREGIHQVDLLKMDIEGAEIELFHSLDDNTLGQIKQITVEFHDFLPYFDQKEDIRQIKKRMKSLGFLCLPYSMTCHADVIFIHRKRSGLSLSDEFHLRFVDRNLRALKRLCGRVFRAKRN
jgi:FkbM family methyltransferase